MCTETIHTGVSKREQWEVQGQIDNLSFKVKNMPFEYLVGDLDG